MFSFLLPKELGFFDQFDQHAALGHEAARVYADMLGRFSDAPAMAARIAELEKQADDVAHKTLEMLHSTFITPIDRDQIHQLVSRLDDVVDLVYGASRRMVLYEIEQPTDALRDLAAVLVRATEEVVTGVRHLRNLKNGAAILKGCAEIHRLETEGDALRDKAMARLLNNETNAALLIKWKEIYQAVEAGLDCCEDVANILEAVVLENN